MLNGSSLRHMCHLEEGNGISKSNFAINSCVFGNFGFGSVEPMSSEIVNVKLICFWIENENDELHFEKFCYDMNTLKNMSKHAMEFTNPEKASENKAKQRIYDEERDKTPARRARDLETDRREKKKEIDAARDRIRDKTPARRARDLETDRRENKTRGIKG